MINNQVYFVCPLDKLRQLEPSSCFIGSLHIMFLKICREQVNLVLAVSISCAFATDDQPVNRNVCHCLESIKGDRGHEVFSDLSKDVCQEF